VTADAFRASIMEFQRFAGLRETGELDEDTEEMMKMPRCGVKDMIGPGARAKRDGHSRSKRYALQGGEKKP